MSNPRFDPFADVRGRWTRDERDGKDIYRLLDDADALLATRDARIEISEQEEENCGYCSGSGGRYADGNAHYPSENAPMVPCGQCGGYGKVPPTDAREIALDALAALPERLK